MQLAQWAGSRRDLFSTELCERLGTLHSTTKPHALSHTIRIVEEVFNKPFYEVFETFEPKVLGSGAIAQVYRAKLRSNLLPPSYLSAKRKAQIMTPLNPFPPPAPVPSAYVAVKVLHPKVEDMIRRDLSIMKFFAKALSMVPSLSWLSLDQEVEVFGSMMYEQLDLRHEARNLKKFEENFKTRRAAISFPRPLEDYSTDKLLLEEFEDAIPMTAFLSGGGGSYERQIATAGLDAFLVCLSSPTKSNL
jgi:aarF domain-containing kinase